MKIKGKFYSKSIKDRTINLIKKLFLKKNQSFSKSIKWKRTAKNNNSKGFNK